MTVPARIKRDPSISTTHKAVLSAVDSHVGKDGYAIRQNTIATELGLSLRTISRALKWLVEEGYLVTTKRNGEGGARLANHYELGPRCRSPYDTHVVPPTTPMSYQEEQPLEEQPLEEPRDLLRPMNTKEGSVDLSTQTNAREDRPIRHKGASLGGSAQQGVRPTKTTLSSPGAPPSVAAESVRSATPPEEQPHDHEHCRMTAIERVLDRLDRVQRNGTTTLASCPVASHGRGNGDRNPSLSVTEQQGKVLLNCMGGCHVMDVMVALDLDFSDLWDEPITNSRGEKVAEWLYTLPDGSDHLIVERWNTPGGDKRFVQRRPGHTASEGLGTNFWNVLYRLPKVIAAAKAGEPIWIVEGEKCVAAAERLGLVATTGPGGAKNWKDYYGKWLVGTPLVNIVSDNDDVGRAYAAMVAASLKGRHLKVRTWAVAVPGEKADLYDHVLAGKSVTDLVPTKLNQFRPEGRVSGPLLDQVFPPVEWVIRDLMPIGFTVLGGAPKVGKSFLALDAAMNVALGGEFMHTQRCERGSVLYLSLDNDAEWRLQLRLRHLQMQYGVSLADTDIEFHTDFPTGEAGIQGIAEWCADKREEGRRPLLVVADTIGKAEPNFDGTNARGETSNGGYQGSTKNLSKWSQLALEQRIGIMGVHHIRKSGDDDWTNRFIGSQGIVATATTLMMLDPKQRGSNEGVLHVTSRDAGDHELEVRRDGWSWQLIEEAKGERIVTKGNGGLRVIHGEGKG